MNQWIGGVLAIGMVACGSGADSDPDGAPGAPDAAPPTTVEAELAGFIVEVTDAPARIRVTDSNGTVVLDDGAASFRTAAVTIEEGLGSYRFDEQAGPWNDAARFTNVRVDGDAVVFELDGGDGEIRAVADGTLRITARHDDHNRATMAFACADTEHFLGFGAQTHDVDHRGHTFPVFVTEQGNGKVDVDEQPDNWFIRGTRHQSPVAIPFFLSSRGYGVLGGSLRRSVFSLCDADEDGTRWRYEAWDADVTFHLFAGPDPLSVIRRYTDFVGRPPVPPPFVFAPWNDAVGGSASVRDVAATLRDNDIPSSVIWAEDWAGSSGDETNLFLDHNWTASDALYPDFSTLAGELHDDGFKFLGYFSTFAYRDSGEYVSDHFQEGFDAEYYVRDENGDPYVFPAPRLGLGTGLVDLTNPDAVDWMAGYMHAALDAGLDGWMADYGEWMRLDATTLGGDDAFEIHNRYPVLWQQLNERVLGERTDGIDRIVFARSGFTGSQGIAHQVVWGADQATMFEPHDGFPTTIPIGIGLGVSGFPYYGSDIAGYSEWSSASEGTNGATNPPSTKELFFRWTAAGALMPVMRTHHGRRASENWSFQRDAETLDHWRRYARLHIQLFPYWLALAHEAAASGAPLMRAMALDFPEDDAVWGLTDQYMLGPDLLVAPVVEEGVVLRSVYFPDARWLPLAGGAPIDGPIVADVAAPVTEIPAFARAGTVLVMLPDSIDTLAPATTAGIVGLGDVADDRLARVFLGADGAFTEADSARTYTLSSDRAVTTGVVLSAGGTPLAVCDPTPVAPCATVDELNRRASAFIVGDGTLTVEDAGGVAATITTAGGASDRALEVAFQW